MRTVPELLCTVGKIIWDKRLSDMAGGNISAREGEQVYMSPRYSGSRFHWSLTPDDLVCGNWQDDVISEDPRFSREGWSHLLIYRTFPDVQAVIHAHPFHVMPFAALCKPMEPVLEGTQKFGIIQPIQPAQAHSKELAYNIIEGMRGLEERMLKQAAVVLIPYHGVILAGHDLLLTLDALERVDVNAYCLLARKTLE